MGTTEKLKEDSKSKNLTIDEKKERLLDNHTVPSPSLDENIPDNETPIPTKKKKSKKKMIVMAIVIIPIIIFAIFVLGEVLKYHQMLVEIENLRMSSPGYPIGHA